MCNIFKNQSFYLQAEVFNKPLVSQEIARHVGVSVIDQRPQAQSEQLQVHLLHCLIQDCVLSTNNVTTKKKTTGIIISGPFKT